MDHEHKAYLKATLLSGAFAIVAGLSNYVRDDPESLSAKFSSISYAEAQELRAEDSKENAFLAFGVAFAASIPLFTRRKLNKLEKN